MAGAGRNPSPNKAECDNVLKKITRGDLEALRLTGRERQIFVAAAEALVPTGISLDIAAREFASAFEILGHDAIIEAARFYKKHVESELPDITVTEAVAKFAEAKAAEGMSKTYLKDIRGSKADGAKADGKPPSAGLLGRFATAFQCNLKKAVMPDDIRAYMAGLKVGPVAKNNHRRLIVALFNFAKEQKWLRQNETTAAEAMKNIKIKGRNVAIFTPQEMSRLLSAAEEKFLPWIALIGFGVVRREELKKGLQWDAIDFERHCIIVPAAIAKGGERSAKSSCLPICAHGWHHTKAALAQSSPSTRAATWKRSVIVPRSRGRRTRSDIRSVVTGWKRQRAPMRSRSKWEIARRS